MEILSVASVIAESLDSSNKGGTTFSLSRKTVFAPLGGIISDKKMNEKTYNYPAIKARYPVTLLTAEGYVQGETRLINNRGALIRCHQPPKLHEAATISIDVSENETLLVEAEVVRLESYEPDNNDEVAPRGMVVRFTNSSAIGRKRLRNLIGKHYLQKLNRLAAKK